MASEYFDNVKIFQITEKLFRLQSANTTEDETRRIFAKRGIDYQVNADAIRGIGIALDLDAALDRIFNQLNFFPTRFGDGTFPVFYGALKQETSIAEISFHLVEKLEEGLEFKYLLFTCEFSGTVADLVGRENAHPELISVTTSGYPFCQGAAKVLRVKANAIHTISARLQGEICVPVFVRETVSNGASIAHYIFNLDNGIVVNRSA